MSQPRGVFFLHHIVAMNRTAQNTLMLSTAYLLPFSTLINRALLASIEQGVLYKRAPSGSVAVSHYAHVGSRIDGFLMPDIFLAYQTEGSKTRRRNINHSSHLTFQTGNGPQRP